MNNSVSSEIREAIESLKNRIAILEDTVAWIKYHASIPLRECTCPDDPEPHIHHVPPEQLSVSVGLPEAIIPAGEGTRTILEGLQKPIWVSKSEPEENDAPIPHISHCR